MGVGDRAPDDERAGREEAHEQRKTADPPGNVTPPREETLHILTRRGKGDAGEHHARGKQQNGYIV